MAKENLKTVFQKYTHHHLQQYSDIFAMKKKQQNPQTYRFQSKNSWGSEGNHM